MMNSAVVSRLAGGLLLLFVFTTGSAQAQNWHQEVQILTPVTYGSPLNVFLDSVLVAFEQNPDLQVRRSPADVESMTYRELSENLLDDGLTLPSASHVFLRYSFKLQNNHIVETLQEMHFIYRGDTDMEDLSILAVNTRNPVIQSVLYDQGTSSLLNMNAFTPFRRTMSFLLITRGQDTHMVEMARTPLRGGYQHEQDVLVEFLTNHMSRGGGHYVLEKRQKEVVVASVRKGPVVPAETSTPEGEQEE